MVLAIILVFFTQNICSVSPDFTKHISALTYPELELYLNNGYVRGIIDAPVDRLRPLKYDMRAKFKVLSEFTTHQYSGLNLVDPILVVPNQNRPALGGNAMAAPMLDAFNVLGMLNFSTNGLVYKGFEIKSKIEAIFGGLASVGALFTLFNAYIEMSRSQITFYFGLKPHVFAQEPPTGITVNFGIPITQNIVNVPQVTSLVDWNKNTQSIFSLYQPYLIKDLGPYGFSDSYAKWSGRPGFAFCQKFFYENLMCGFAICSRTIRPRIFTSNRFVGAIITQSVGSYLAPPVHNPDYVGADKEFLTSTKAAVFCAIDSGCWHSLIQLVAGSNGIDFFNFGGYGVTNFNQIINSTEVNPATFNFNWTYHNISYISFFSDIELKKPFCGLQPGIFIGYTQPLPMRYPLARDTQGKFVIYTIDQLFQNLQNVTNPDFNKERVFGYLRIAPRCWLTLGEQVKFGSELNFVTTWYSLPDEYYRPLNKKPVTLLRATACCFIDI
jgi:hypothetical protein